MQAYVLVISFFFCCGGCHGELRRRFTGKCVQLVGDTAVVPVFVCLCVE